MLVAALLTLRLLLIIESLTVEALIPQNPSMIRELPLQPSGAEGEFSHFGWASEEETVFLGVFVRLQDSLHMAPVRCIVSSWLIK